MKKLMYGLFVAVAMTLTTLSFADTYVDTGVFNADPVFSEVALLTTDPPMVPANRPQDTGPGKVTDNRRTLSVAYYQVHSAKIPKTVITVGALATVADVPSKVPI